MTSSTVITPLPKFLGRRVIGSSSVNHGCSSSSSTACNANSLLLAKEAEKDGGPFPVCHGEDGEDRLSFPQNQNVTGFGAAFLFLIATEEQLLVSVRTRVVDFGLGVAIGQKTFLLARLEVGESLVMSHYDLILTTFRIRFNVAQRLAATQNLAGFRLKVSRGGLVTDLVSPNHETPERRGLRRGFC